MDRPYFLWMDLTDKSLPCTQLEELRKQYNIQYPIQAEEFSQAISTRIPAAICIEFDIPSSSNLDTILQVKRNSDLPVLLVTEDRSLPLALWALRARVWDYFVKPLDVHEFDKSIQRILSSSGGMWGQAQSLIGFPPTLTEPDGTGGRKGTPAAKEDIPPNRTELAVYRAIRFVEENYSEGITQTALAREIAMSPAHFSRTFHRVTGMTFSTYLNATRVRVAMRLLKNTSLSITSLGYEVGFHDPSHFCRTFRRIAGVAPSAYREKYTKHGAQDASMPMVSMLPEQAEALTRMAAVYG